MELWSAGIAGGRPEELTASQKTVRMIVAR